MSGITLKLDNIVVNKKEFYVSKQQIDLNLVEINKIVILTNLSIEMMVSNILLAPKKIISLDLYVLFTSNEWIHKIFWKWMKNYVFYD